MSRKMTCSSSASPLLRLFLIAAMVPALASCVTYYYPAAEGADGVYYAADDPAYVDHAADFTAVRYYPWWSIDYFYLGYGHRYGDWSVGLSYGSPWHPYRPWWVRSHFYPSWHYDPWYSSHWYAPYYRHYPWRGHAWYQPYWHTRFRHYHGGYRYGGHRGDHGYRGRGDHRGRGSYAGYRGRYEDGRRVPGHGADPYRGASRGRGERSTPGTGATVRRVTVAPDGRPGDRGMVIHNRDGGKWSRSRLEPDVGPVRNTGVARGGRPEPARVNERGSEPVTTQRGGAVVRHPAPAKRRPPRTEPVPAPRDSRRVREAESRFSSRPRTSYQPRSDGDRVTIRRNAHTKVAPQRLQPTRPARIVTPRGAVSIAAPVQAPATGGGATVRRSAPIKAAPHRVQPIRRAPPVVAPARAASAPPARTVRRTSEPRVSRPADNDSDHGSRARPAHSRGDRQR